MPAPYARPMRMLVSLVMGVGLLAAAQTAAAEPQGGVWRHPAEPQGGAFQHRIAYAQRGPAVSPREIESRIVASMNGAEYLGFIYDPGTNIYTFKFRRNLKVIWIDVDGRTGRVIGQKGN